MSSLSRCIHLTACRCDWVTTSISPCIFLIKLQQVSRHGHDVSHQMINYAFSSLICFILALFFSFWDNPLSLYCCKHLANEPILRQWSLPPIKALKSSEDLLVQERKGEMEIDIWATNKKEWLRWFSQVLVWTLHFEEYLQQFLKPAGSRASACDRLSMWPLNQALQQSPGSPEKLHC